MRTRVGGFEVVNKLLTAEKCARLDINSPGMTASKNVGQSPKRSDTPLWRLKANYVLRELVRAWHGRPYDSAVMWGVRYALNDILHTFAKENDLPIPKLFFWFERFWEKYSGYLGERVFTALDRSKLMEVMLRGFPSSRPELCKSFFYDQSVYGIMHLYSVLFLWEVGRGNRVLCYKREKWPLGYYESLPVAPLDSFTIWYVKRAYGGLTET
jgi:hypothetical protein